MLRLGLIGTGRWGKVYLRTIEGMGTRLRLTQTAASRPEGAWKKLVVSPEVDAVIIATPAPLHAGMARACLEAGKPVIVEKPLCFDAATAETIRKESEKAKLPVRVNYIHLYNPAYRALKQAVSESGEPVRAVVSEGTDLGPFRPDTGALWDRCPHDVALLLDLMGADRPVERIRALGGLPDPQGRPEMATLNLLWKGGASGWIHAGRLLPAKRRTLSVFTDSTLFHFDDQAAVRCRRIPFDYAGREKLGGAPASKEGEPIPVPDRRAPMEVMLAEFADQVEKKRAPGGLELTVELTRILEHCARLFSSSKEVSCAS